MTMKVGGIEFDIDVDASGVTSASKTVQTDLTNIETSFKKTDASANKLTGGATKTGKSLSGLGKNAGQAGIQIQQFAGQIQGGQSALLALSQQGADLGIVLGQAGLGAAVGLSATALALLISSAGDAESALDDLEKIADTVGKTLEQAADGSDVFSESIQRLATRSEALARVQIAQTISDLEEQISTSAQGIRSAVNDFAAIGLRDFNQIALESGLTMEELAQKAEELSDVVGSNLNGRGLSDFANAVDFVGRKFDLSTEQAIGLASAISEFQNDQGPVGIARLRSEIESLEGELGAGNKRFNQFAAALLPFFDATRTGVDRINLLRQALTDLDGEIKKNSEAGKEAAAAVEEQNQASQKRIELLTAQIIALEHGAQAAEVYAATQRAVANGEEEQLQKTIELINKKYELKRAQEQSIQASRDEIEQQKAYSSILDEIFAKEEARARQKDIDAKSASQKLESFKQSLMSEEQLRAEYYNRELEQFLSAAEVLGLSKDEIRELEKQKAQQHAEELISIEEKRAKKEQDIEDAKNKAKLSAISGVFGNISSLMNTESKKMFEIGKAAATAGAIVDGIAAVQGAYKQGAKIGGPALGAAFAASAAVATLANIKQIQSTQYGSKSSGQSYQGGKVVNNTQQPQQVTQRNISISLAGSGSFTGGDIRGLINSINEELGDGATLAVTGG